MAWNKIFDFQHFFGKSVIPAYSRPIGYFFQDMQRTLDEPDMESMNMALLIFSNILYTSNDEVGERELWEHMYFKNLDMPDKKNRKSPPSVAEKLLRIMEDAEAKRYEEGMQQAKSIQLPEKVGFPLKSLAETADQRAFEENLKQLFQEERSERFEKHREIAVKEYYYRIEKANDQFNKYRTLIHAEKQQKAYERQLAINRRIPPSILPDLGENDLNGLCEELYDAKVKFGFNGLKKEICFEEYKLLYEKCKVQPIAAALLPVVFTIFSTDERISESTSVNGQKISKKIYPYFKYKDRHLTAEAQERIIAMFECISMSVDKWISVRFDMPIFRWGKIARDFAGNNNLPREDYEIAIRYFARYLDKNGLSKEQERVLIELPYGAKIRSLAKLYNINTFLMMGHLPKEMFPAKAKKPYQQLKDGELLGKRSYDTGDRFPYINDNYIVTPCNPSFCYLALVRYYRLPIDLDKDFMELSDHEHEFFPVMKDNITVLLNSFCSRIRSSYEAGTGYRSISPAQKIAQYSKYAYTFSGSIRSCFKAEDYMEFITDIDNFKAAYFPRYLDRFCEKYGIETHNGIDESGKCYLEVEAFTTILSLIKYTLLYNFEKFWQKKIADVLYS